VKKKERSLERIERRFNKEKKVIERLKGLKVLVKREMTRIIREKCDGCGNCIEVCPFNVLKIEKGKAVVKNPERCRKCGACVSACPNNAIILED